MPFTIQTHIRYGYEYSPIVNLTIKCIRIISYIAEGSFSVAERENTKNKLKCFETIKKFF